MSSSFSIFNKVEATLLPVITSYSIHYTKLYEPARGRREGRLALAAAAALGFVTVAIPLQLDREWITIGWALEAAAVAWLVENGIPPAAILLLSFTRNNFV